MKRADVIDRLKAVEPALRAVGVAGLYLFGSYARNEAGAESDVDVFIDPADDNRFGFSEFMDAYEALQSAFPETEIGYGTRDGLAKFIRAEAEQEAIRVF